MFPWEKVQDFLLEVGSAKTREEFNRKVFAGVQRLIPYDVAVGFFDPRTFKLLFANGLSASVDKAYNEHYYGIHPWLTRWDIPKVYASWRVDWGEYRDSEYVTDFARPNSLRFAIMHPGLDGRPSLSLQRSRWMRMFTDHEREIIGVINPHLVNLGLLLDRLSQGAYRSVLSREEIAERFTGLTRRETEVFSLLIKGYTASEIGTSLFISERTVECHVQNIYGKLDVHTKRQAVEAILRQMSPCD